MNTLVHDGVTIESSVAITPAMLDLAEGVKELDAKLAAVDREDEYLASGGSKCPFCKSTNIEGGIITDFDADYATSSCECHDCGKEWKDVYGLTGIDED